MFKRVCFLVRDNPNDPKAFFAQGLARALGERGVDCLILTSKEGSMSPEDAVALEEFQADLTSSFSCIYPLPSGEFLWDHLGIPHFHYNLDPVLYTLHHYQSPLVRVSCVDRAEVDLLHHVGKENAFFLPHACDKAWTFSPEQARPLDIVLIGSCYDHEALRRRWQEQLPSDWWPILDHAIDAVLGDKKTNFVDAVGQALEASSLAPKEVPFRELCRYVDYYCRGRDRWELIRGLEGLPIDIYGEVHEETDFHSQGWKGYLASRKEVRLHGSVTYAESMQIMAQSKFCLNTSPSFKQGSHERVFASLAFGAVPVTGQNLFWEEEFVHEESLLFYFPKRWGELREVLEHYRHHEEERQVIASKGEAIVKRRHTWDQRAETLLRTL